jgi:hypothetical protein
VITIDNERFNKDFATYDRKVREEQHKLKMDAIERKR